MAQPNAPAWRSGEFMTMARRVVSARQFDRFKRMYSQPFFVLAGEVRPAEMVFTVSGSERDAYILRLVRSTGRISCSCRDACVNGARLGCICKHACFLLYRVLRLGDVRPMTTRSLSAELFDSLVARATQVVERAGGARDAGDAGDAGAKDRDRVARRGLRAAKEGLSIDAELHGVLIKTINFDPTRSACMRDVVYGSKTWWKRAE